MRATTRLGCTAVVALACALLGCQEPPPAVSPELTLPSPEAFGSEPATIDFAELVPFLPELPGWTEPKDEGSTGKYGPVSVSEAERIATRGEREVRVRIVDTTLKERLGQAIRAAADQALELEGPDSERAVVMEDGIGFVRYDQDRGKAELNLLVGDRYVVAVIAVGVGGTAEVRSIVHSLDLAGLARLR